MNTGMCIGMKNEKLYSVISFLCLIEKICTNLPPWGLVMPKICQAAPLGLLFNGGNLSENQEEKSIKKM